MHQNGRLAQLGGLSKTKTKYRKARSSNLDQTLATAYVAHYMITKSTHMTTPTTLPEQATTGVTQAHNTEHIEIITSTAVFTEQGKWTVTTAIRTNRLITANAVIGNNNTLVYYGLPHQPTKLQVVVRVYTVEKQSDVTQVQVWNQPTVTQVTYGVPVWWQAVPIGWPGNRTLDISGKSLYATAPHVRRTTDKIEIHFSGPVGEPRPFQLPLQAADNIEYILVEAPGSGRKTTRVIYSAGGVGDNIIKAN